MATVPAQITETLRATDRGGYITARSLTLQEVMVISAGAAQALWRRKASITERLRFRSSTAGGGSYGLSLQSRLQVGASVRVTQAALLRAAMGISSRLSAAQLVAVRDTLQLAAHQAAVATFSAALREVVNLHATGPSIRLGGSLRSSLTLSDEPARTARTIEKLAATLRLEDALSRRLMIGIIYADELRLTGYEALGAILQGTLRDGIEFFIDVLDPGGDVTTWAMNVRTGAVTEYMNYDFNSFAQSRSGTYLGASDTGLYELVGQDDAGTDVIADVISGLVDFSGSFLSSVQAAYIGVRGGGEYFLKLTTGTDKSYTYAVKATSLRTSRVNIGKGLRARYFTWELISTGQDFDLTDITFLPVQQTRRI